MKRSSILKLSFVFTIMLFFANAAPAQIPANPDANAGIVGSNVKPISGDEVLATVPQLDPVTKKSLMEGPLWSVDFTLAGLGSGAIDGETNPGLYSRITVRKWIGGRVLIGVQLAPEAYAESGAVKDSLRNSPEFVDSVQEALVLGISKAYNIPPQYVTVPPALLAATVESTINSKITQGAEFEAFTRELFVTVEINDRFAATVGKTHCATFDSLANQFFCSSVPRIELEMKMNNKVKVAFSVYNGRLLSIESPDGILNGEVEELLRQTGGILSYAVDSGSVTATVNTNKIGNIIVEGGVRSGQNAYSAFALPQLNKLLPGLLKQYGIVNVGGAVEKTPGGGIYRESETALIPVSEKVIFDTEHYGRYSSDATKPNFQSMQAGVKYRVLQLKGANVYAFVAASRSTGPDVFQVDGRKTSITILGGLLMTRHWEAKSAPTTPQAPPVH